MYAQYTNTNLITKVELLLHYKIFKCILVFSLYFHLSIIFLGGFLNKKCDQFVLSSVFSY